MENKKQLIDDTGLHKDMRSLQSTIFVVLCRIFTVILILLGVMALLPME